MNLKDNEIKKYQLLKTEIMLLWLNSYEFGEPINKSINFAKFEAINKFANFF